MNVEPNYFEPTDSAELLARRKDSARHTLRTVFPDELHALVRELFPDEMSPFAGAFSDFIDEHRSETAVRGETSDGIAFVYYPRSNRGMWCLRAGDTVQGVGLLGENDLKAVSELCALAGHF
ncbi:MAG: hypothetical protein JO015_10760 [Verrucomicrobia bacterium]|nr:hypothetical protein [Verrucomicrobiota bacterium]